MKKLMYLPSTDEKKDYYEDVKYISGVIICRFGIRKKLKHRSHSFI